MSETPRVALFIDAENVAPANAAQVLESAHTLGNLRIARCYGNDDALRGWRDAIAKHHLVPRMTPPVSGKQNASDFALTIEAVTLQSRNLFDVALIASSDADFAPLALHLRESGNTVCCIGDHRKLKANYRTLFDRVFEFPSKARKTKTQSATAPVEPQRKDIPAAIPAADLIAHFKDYQKGSRRVTVNSFGRFVGNRLPSGYRRGFRNVAEYLRATGLFEIGKDNSISLKE